MNVYFSVPLVTADYKLGLVEGEERGGLNGRTSVDDQPLS